VIPAAVAERVGLMVDETADYRRLIAEGSERLKNRRELEAGALGGRRPLVHDDAVGHVDEREPERRAFARGGLRGLAERGRDHGVEHRQRDGRADAADEMTTGEMLAGDDHDLGSAGARRRN
jgi:hypothetical protein